MRKTILTLLFGLLLLTGSALADVDCDAGLSACQLIDPKIGNWAPAVLFTVTKAQRVHIEALIYQGVTDCSGPADMAVGDLDLMSGDVRVFIRFDPPLPPGSVLSVVWTVDNCPPTDCLSYTLDGSDPAECPMGADATIIPMSVQ